MLVTHISGDCPLCGGTNTFGNVSITGNCINRGCTACIYRDTVLLPEIRKKILYLDQYFFSGAFRGKDERFVRAAKRFVNFATCNY